LPALLAAGFGVEEHTGEGDLADLFDGFALDMREFEVRRDGQSLVLSLSRLDRVWRAGSIRVYFICLTVTIQSGGGCRAFELPGMWLRALHPLVDLAVVVAFKTGQRKPFAAPQMQDRG
jgi:hypothetical protein